MKRTLTLLLALALALPAAAQEEKRKLALELVDALGTKSLAAAALDALLPRIQEETLPAELTEEDRPAWEAQKQKRIADMKALRERVVTSMNHERFATDVFIPALETAFSTDELREVTTLLRTPTGQKLARVLPQLFLSASTKGAGLLEREVNRVAAELRAEERKKYPWKTTVAEMRELAVALDTYVIGHNAYPEGTLEDVRKALEGDLIGRVPMQDVWGTALVYVSNGVSYRLISAGADKQFSATSRDIEAHPRPRVSEDPGADIIFQDGMLVQSPSEKTPAAPTPQ